MKQPGAQSAGRQLPTDAPALRRGHRKWPMHLLRAPAGWFFAAVRREPFNDASPSQLRTSATSTIFSSAGCSPRQIADQSQAVNEYRQRPRRVLLTQSSRCAASALQVVVLLMPYCRAGRQPDQPVALKSPRLSNRQFHHSNGSICTPSSKRSAPISALKPLPSRHACSLRCSPASAVRRWQRWSISCSTHHVPGCRASWTVFFDHALHDDAVRSLGKSALCQAWRQLRPQSCAS